MTVFENMHAHMCDNSTLTQSHITYWIFLYEACGALYTSCTVLAYYTNKHTAYCFSPTWCVPYIAYM